MGDYTGYQMEIAELSDRILELRQMLVDRDAKLAQKEMRIAHLRDALNESSENAEIKLRQRVEELERKLEDAQSIIDAQDALLQERDAKLKVAKEALEFYAKATSWETQPNDKNIVFVPATFMEFRIARRALAKIEGMK